jgi:hypothetical protein
MTTCGNVIIPVSRTSSARPDGSFARLTSAKGTPRFVSRDFATRQNPHGSVV